MIVIIGAGLSGLSASYHLGHKRCLILEKESRPFGHIASTKRDGFVWDTGPHVSFTKHAYVQSLFNSSVSGALEEYEVKVANYYQGSWITHPAQTSLHQVPEPLRSSCLESFLAARSNDFIPLPPDADYQQWLERTFGTVFSRTFPETYTRKYWTRDASKMTTGWIGGRIPVPNIDEVVAGSRGPLARSTHYISKVRYPRSGGYEAFGEHLRQGSRVRYGAEVSSIDLTNKQVFLTDGQQFSYSQLINTMPLPVFIEACVEAPQSIKSCARRLSCTHLLLINVAAPHATRRPEHWMYVYDEDKWTTRINCTEMLAADNAPSGWTGVQAEVYFSRHRPLTVSPEEIAEKVESELVEMGLIDPSQFADGLKSHRHVHQARWANVIFDHETAPALDAIWTWLTQFGLQREEDDISPLTDWNRPDLPRAPLGSLSMAGRFGQWKYYWSDDCVLRGKRIADRQASVTETRQ